MITPQEINRKAESRYKDVLRAWLDGETIFPMSFPIGKLADDLAERRMQIDQLRTQSKAERGFGYTLIWTTTQKRNLGTQTYPTHANIETQDDYLALIRKRGEFNDFMDDVRRIRRVFPSLEAWIHEHPSAVIEHHGHWDDLLTVCDYFTKHPRPHLYLRELPISVHTKFIEQNKPILRELLDIILPAEQINADTTDFHLRFGLKDKPALVRLRLLDEQMDWKFGLRIDDLSLPVKQLAHLLSDHLRPRHVIIVENLINFLTLPALPNTVALLGGGFAVHLLRDVAWLASCDVVYWGDIDAHGFQILSDLRQLFPVTRSVMMDQATFDQFRAYIHIGVAFPNERYATLTDEERTLAREVNAHNHRLEQEHIPQVYAVACLRKAILG